MAVVDKTILKSYFETGDRPTESNFIDLIDSMELITDASGSFFAEGGDAFGANAVIGTTDNFSFALQANNIVALTIDTSGNVIVTNINGTSGGLNFTDVQGGGTYFNDPNGGGTYFSDPNHGGIFLNSTGNGIFLTGDSNQFGVGTDGIVIYTPYSASSGSTAFQFFEVRGSINQSGTANGIVRGIYYNPTITSVIGSHYAFEATSGMVKISDTTASADATTGALTVAGGVGIAGVLTVAGGINMSTTRNILTTASTASITMGGDTGVNTGASLKVHGSAHSTNPDQGILRVTGSDIFTWTSAGVSLIGNLQFKGGSRAITDDSGNNLVAFPATVASAVNYIQISNAASGSSPNISVQSGTDSDVSMVFASKGRPVNAFFFTANTTNSTSSAGFAIANTLNAAGDATINHYNATSANSLNRSVIRLVQNNASGAAVNNTYIWGKSTGTAAGSEYTQFGVDVMNNGVRTNSFLISGSVSNVQTSIISTSTTWTFNSNIFSVNGTNGTIQINGAGGSGLQVNNSNATFQFQNAGGSNTNPNHFSFNYASSLTATTNTNMLSFIQTIAPTAGTGSYASINLAQTYNQTGTASGTIRGIYYNPTVTSVRGTHNAWESTSGNMVLGGTNSVSLLLQNNGSTPVAALSSQVTGRLKIGGGFTVTSFFDTWLWNSAQFTVPANGTVLINANNSTDIFNFKVVNTANIGIQWGYQSGKVDTSGTFIVSKFQYNTAPATASTANQTSLQFGESYNLPAGSTGIMTSIDINPNFTNLVGSYYGIRLRSNSNPVGGGTVYNIYADGTAPNLFAGQISITNTNVSTASTNGAMVVSGGIGIGGNSYFNGDLHLNSTSGNRFLYINAPAGSQSKIEFRKGDSTRWTFESNDTSESGGDAGSDLVLSTFNDSGAYIDSPLFIARVSGGRITFNRNVAVGGSTPSHRLHVTNSIYSVADPGDAYITNLENNSSDSGYKNVLKCIISNSGTTYSDSEFSAFYYGTSKIGKIRLVSGGTSVAYDTTSDERLKENITDTSKGLSDLLAVKVRDYNFKKDSNKYTGFIAQEIAALFPEIVSKGGADPEVNPWMMDYSKITPVVVKAVQDLYHQLKNKGLVD